MWRLGFLALAALIILAACGGDGDADESPAEQADTAAQTDAVGEATAAFEAAEAADADGAAATDDAAEAAPRTRKVEGDRDALEGRIAFVSERDGNPEIYVMNADGSGQTRLTENPAADWGPAWSPDASQIAFVSNRDGNSEIYVMNADGSNQTRITDNSDLDIGPNWSPVDDRIAFVSNRQENPDIYVMNADGSGPTRITDADAHEYGPSFSRDGLEIAFVPETSGQAEIFLIRADGSQQPFRITNNPALDYGPDVSPLGLSIVFVSERASPPDIYVVAPGIAPRRLTDDPGFDVEPAWSPDEQWVVFVTERHSTEDRFSLEIYVVDVAGLSLIRLTNNEHLDYQPAWAPVGTAGPIVASASNIPVELQERRYPVLWSRHMLLPDSGGPGRSRGGLGLDLLVGFPFHPGTLFSIGNRERFGPPGIFAGEAGGTAGLVLQKGTEAERNLGIICADVAIAPGEVASYWSSGGGGYGDPLERPADRVLDDVIDQYVSIAKARAQYGVVVTAIDPRALRYEVDEPATTKLRDEMRAARGN